MRHVVLKFVCVALSLGVLSAAPSASADDAARDAGKLIGPARVAPSADFTLTGSFPTCPRSKVSLQRRTNEGSWTNGPERGHPQGRRLPVRPDCVQPRGRGDLPRRRAGARTKHPQDGRMASRDRHPRQVGTTDDGSVVRMRGQAGPQCVVLGARRVRPAGAWHDQRRSRTSSPARPLADSDGLGHPDDVRHQARRQRLVLGLVPGQRPGTRHPPGATRRHVAVAGPDVVHRVLQRPGQLHLRASYRRLAVVLGQQRPRPAGGRRDHSVRARAHPAPGAGRVASGRQRQHLHPMRNPDRRNRLVLGFQQHRPAGQRHAHQQQVTRPGFGDLDLAVADGLRPHLRHPGGRHSLVLGREHVRSGRRRDDQYAPDAVPDPRQVAISRCRLRHGVRNPAGPDWLVLGIQRSRTGGRREHDDAEVAVPGGRQLDFPRLPRNDVRGAAGRVRLVLGSKWCGQRRGREHTRTG